MSYLPEHSKRIKIYFRRPLWSEMVAAQSVVALNITKNNCLTTLNTYLEVLLTWTYKQASMSSGNEVVLPWGWEWNRALSQWRPFLNRFENFRGISNLHGLHRELSFIARHLHAPDSRNPYGWYPLKMHQITRASPAELRTIVRAIWRSTGYTTICASNSDILDKIKIIPPLWYSGKWKD